MYYGFKSQKLTDEFRQAMEASGAAGRFKHFYVCRDMNRPAVHAFADARRRQISEDGMATWRQKEGNGFFAVAAHYARFDNIVKIDEAFRTFLQTRRIMLERLIRLNPELKKAYLEGLPRALEGLSQRPVEGMIDLNWSEQEAAGDLAESLIVHAITGAQDDGRERESGD